MRGKTLAFKNALQFFLVIYRLPWVQGFPGPGLAFRSFAFQKMRHFAFAFLSPVREFPVRIPLCDSRAPPSTSESTDWKRQFHMSCPLWNKSPTSHITCIKFLFSDHLRNQFGLLSDKHRARELRNLTHELSHESAHENAHGSVHEDVHGEMPTKVEALSV